MKNRKHIVCLIIALVLLLTACGNAAPAASQPTAPAATVPAPSVPETTEATQPPQETRTVLQTMTTEVFMGDMVLVNRTDNIYDDQGLLCETVNYSGETETFRTVFENDEHGEVLRQTADMGGVLQVTDSENTYDESGNLIKKVDTVSMNGTVTDIREYNFNADHKHTSCTFTTMGDPNQVITITYEYDDQGREILETQENTMGGRQQTETQYNENGQVSKRIYRDAAGEITGYSEVIFQEDGTEKQLSYAPDGTPSPSYTVIARNEQGNILTQETYTGDTLTMRLTMTYITVPAFK